MDQLNTIIAKKASNSKKYNLAHRFLHQLLLICYLNHRANHCLIKDSLDLKVQLRNKIEVLINIKIRDSIVTVVKVH